MSAPTATTIISRCATIQRCCRNDAQTEISTIQLSKNKRRKFVFFQIFVFVVVVADLGDCKPELPSLAASDLSREPLNADAAAIVVVSPVDVVVDVAVVNLTDDDIVE